MRPPRWTLPTRAVAALTGLAALAVLLAAASPAGAAAAGVGKTIRANLDPPYDRYYMPAASASGIAEYQAVAASVRDCHTWVYFPNLYISSVRNMSCRRAKREMRRYRRPISRTFRTPGGFYCYRVSGTRLGGQWRCRKGGRAFRFEFGD